MRQLWTSLANSPLLTVLLCLLAAYAGAWAASRVPALASRRSALGWLAFGLWALLILVITLRPLPVEEVIRVMQLVPITPLLEQLRSGDDVAPLLGNVLMFVPFGLAGRFAGARIMVLVLASGALSAAIETAQYMQGAGRQADINDLLLNVLGCLIGAALCAIAIRGVEPTSVDSEPRVCS